MQNITVFSCFIEHVTYSNVCATKLCSTITLSILFRDFTRDSLVLLVEGCSPFISPLIYDKVYPLIWTQQLDFKLVACLTSLISLHYVVKILAGVTSGEVTAPPCYEVNFQ